MKRRSALKILSSSGLAYGLLSSFRPLPLLVNENSQWQELLEVFSHLILGSYYNNASADLEKGVFLQCYIEQCWSEEDQNRYWQTASGFQNYCYQKFEKPFERLSYQRQETVLLDLFDAKKTLFEGDIEWAGLTRQLILFEFFSGQKGATEVLRHLPLPGRYEGQIPLLEQDTLYRH